MRRFTAYLVLAVMPVVLSGCAGCYSFRGGSAPAHLKTIAIPPVDDISGFGRGTVREELYNILVRKFRDDNSLRVADLSEADSRLEVTITSIRTERLNLSGNELETVRGIVVDTRATFTDNVRHRPVFQDRSFSGRAQYNINQGTAGENQAIIDALGTLSDAVLLATVADW